ncbi:peptide chain release factor N(5)-glutamine methyltransferase [Leptospira congkakensis]|uniref:Release factor glutamine methyltransferase n=1 Tax=Leptospira congkakensis TaxID=2484932 RepID=A0A4Z1A5H2_9LEPT|nr:peptide chain release factor N(5)-glutamine methyltransferase [Leptospira congkakensis]TGL86010.1 peptide chain release factor N(5)-glutamine methyltransferase [Leptospira congkakensis]TGL88884.1 peptide chain release factor N(5)-glutamine methyltransferase [Leptospira congkakensis]TGL93387.1 peptide chain release factor N(5)-glutamine methyltransferase [Leptospira congkakensis]
MAEQPGTLLYYLKRSTEFLEKKEIPNPRVDAEWILSDLLNLPRIKLYSQFEMPLGQKEIDIYRERIVERSKRKPVAYITGKKGFHKFEYLVTDDVLIPRPETEELVDYLWKKKEELSFVEPKEIQIWDLCSGSGCIGLSLTQLLPSSVVTLSDLSEKAIDVSRRNAEKYNLKDRTNFYVSDLDSSLPKELQFDLIVSNPPYIPESEKPEIMPDVLDYEPHMALFVSDFKEFHKRLLSAVKSRLLPGGKLMMETHPLYMDDLEEIARGLGFVSTKRILDSSKKDRFFFAEVS